MTNDDKMMTYFFPNNYILRFTALNVTKYIIKNYYFNDKMMTYFFPINKKEMFSKNK